MIISTILDEMQIPYKCYKEFEVDSLGLAGYNAGDRVCTFIENEKYLEDLSDCVKVILTNEKTAATVCHDEINFGIIIVDNPRTIFFKMHNFLSKKQWYCKERFATQIGDNCSIDKTAIIAGNNVEIGNNVVIEEFVVIRENTIIGDNTIIRAGCKIGGEGFEFKREENGIFGVKHVGSVIIGNNVEIQYNTCIDKAIYPWDQTVIEDFCKIDNSVHVAHAVKVGKCTMIVANSGIGGRVTIGNNAWIGFACTIRNGLTIGNGSRVNMGAVVTKNVLEGQAVSGNFAIAHSEFIQNLKKGR